MKIAFATTLSPMGSTLTGRVVPLAQELAKMGHVVHVLGLSCNNARELDKTPPILPFLGEELKIEWHDVGREPFERTKAGKKRLSGFALVYNLSAIALMIIITLHRIKPDAIVIVKALPHNALGVWMYVRLLFGSRVILDVDDFELTSNQLKSIWQRAAIHWAQRLAVALTDTIVAATPFLQDYFRQLAGSGKNVTLIPTGIYFPLLKGTPQNSSLPSLIRGGSFIKTGHRIGYLGSLSVNSGHRVDWLPDILAAVRKIFSEATMLIAGTGDSESEIKKSFNSKGLGDCVRWLGRFDHGQVAAILSEIDVLIDPVDTSVTCRAKSSYRVILAMGAGMPVVTSNVGIRPLIIPRFLHNRSFAAPMKPGDYADKIAVFFNQPLTVQEQSFAVEHAQKFSWVNLSKKYSQLLSQP